MKKRILILDDNPENNSIFTSPLKDLAQIDDVMRFDDAEALLDLYDYDLLIIDVMMPAEDLTVEDEITAGYRFYDEILKEKNLNIPILFWSNLLEDSFNQHFESTLPDNVFFLHIKRTDHSHLLNWIKERIYK